MKTEPQKEHAWLQQLVGEWTFEVEATMEPGKPPEHFRGTERVRSLGGLWIVAEGEGEMPGGGTARWGVRSDQRRRTTYGANGSASWNGAGGWGVGYGVWVSARPMTPLRAAPQRGSLVGRKVVAAAHGQQVEDRIELFKPFPFVRPIGQSESGRVLLNGLGDLGKRQDAIDHSRGDSAQEHGVELSRVRSLHDGQTARGAHFAQAKRAIGAAAGKNHANRSFAQFFGQGTKEKVDRHAQAAAHLPLGEIKAALVNPEKPIGGNGIDAVGGDGHAVCARTA